jgi:hypothetical protein
VTTAKRPFAGWDVASDSADLPDGLSETFFAEGLDSPNQFEMPAEISLCAHWIFDPIYGNHAPHLASVEEIRAYRPRWDRVPASSEDGVAFGCFTCRPHGRAMGFTRNEADYR